MTSNAMLTRLRQIVCGIAAIAASAGSARAVTIVNYRMQETNPAHVSIAADSSGFGNNGTYLYAFGGPGSITNTNDHPVAAVNPGKQFNVSGDRGAHIAFDPSNASIAAPTGSASIEFLIRPQADTFTSGLLALYANDGPFSPGDVHLNINGTNLEFAVSGHASHPSVDIASRLSISEWGHIAVTYGGGLVSFYVNGDLVGSGATAGVAANIHNAANIGAWINGTSSRFYRGGLDEFSIHDTTLTAEQVRQSAQSFVVSVPEPAGLPLLALGMLAVSAKGRRRAAARCRA